MRRCKFENHVNHHNTRSWRSELSKVRFSLENLLNFMGVHGKSERIDEDMYCIPKNDTKRMKHHNTTGVFRKNETFQKLGPPKILETQNISPRAWGLRQGSRFFLEIIDFPSRSGLLRLGNSYDNIEWGPGKIRVFKMSPTILVFTCKIGFVTAGTRPLNCFFSFFFLF